MNNDLIMKVVIVDDEKLARERLNRMITSIEGFEVAGEAINGSQALTVIEKIKPDIVLMDIRMPGIDGIEAARHLDELDEPPAIIFTTAYTDHALEAFETHAVDYLLKPVKKDSLEGALSAAIKPNRAQVSITNIDITDMGPRKHICARVRGNLVLIPLSTVYYFQADQKYVTVRHSDGEVLIEEPLKNLEIEFANDFCRIHRNALVRLSKISGLKSSNDGHRVSFSDIEDTLEVSRRHLPGVRKILKQL